MTDSDESETRVAKCQHACIVKGKPVPEALGRRVEAGVTLAVDLVVQGVDLADEDVVEALAEMLDDMGWSSVDGRVSATVYVEQGDDLVAAVIDAAHRIEHAVSGATCVRVDDDLVSAADIASRTGVTREAVRLWSLGKRGPGGFPATRGTIGGAAAPIRVWAWRDVVRWLKKNYGICSDEVVPTECDIAEINSHLQRVPHAIDREWQRLGQPNLHADVHVSTFVGAAVTEPQIRRSLRRTQSAPAEVAGFVLSRVSYV